MEVALESDSNVVFGIDDEAVDFVRENNSLVDVKAHICTKCDTTRQVFDQAQFDQLNSNLSDQFKTGILQQRIKAQLVDPHTLIHRAILEDASLEVITFLLDHGVDVDYPDENGMSPLTMAILCQYPKIVKALLQRGAEVDPLFKWKGMSLLELSVTGNDMTSAKCLISAGANINAKFKDGKTTPLTYAFNKAATGQWEWNFVDTLFQTNKLNEESLNEFLNLSVRSGYFTFVRECINQGADINYCNGAALSMACFMEKLDMVKYLLANGADPNLHNDFLHYAVWNGNLPILRELLKANANPDIYFKNPVGNPVTPLVEAIQYRKVDMWNPNPHEARDAKIAMEMTRILVESGADVNAKGKNDVSPLAAAIDAGRMEIARYLMQHGATG